jgi:hypothetical protein
MEKVCYFFIFMFYLRTCNSSTSGGEKKEIEKKITELGLTYNLASKCTSFIAIEVREDPTLETMVAAVPGESSRFYFLFTIYLYFDKHLEMSSCVGGEGKGKIVQKREFVPGGYV